MPSVYDYRVARQALHGLRLIMGFADGSRLITPAGWCMAPGDKVNIRIAGRVARRGRCTVPGGSGKAAERRVRCGGGFRPSIPAADMRPKEEAQLNARVRESYFYDQAHVRYQELIAGRPHELYKTLHIHPCRDCKSSSAHLCLAYCYRFLVPGDDIASGRKAHGDPQDAGHLLTHLCDQLGFLPAGHACRPAGGVEQMLGQAGFSRHPQRGPALASAKPSRSSGDRRCGATSPSRLAPCNANVDAISRRTMRR